MPKFFLIFLLLFSYTLNARDWNQQKSEHFTIIYNAKQRQLANYYLSTAEKVYSELIPLFKEAPTNTYLVLIDYYDFSNGAATVFPAPTVYLYPHLPDIHDSIENHSSWAYLLLKHEYTHILNMYPSHGIPGFLHWIFGSWVKPNMMLPTWYLEGLAVERESENTERFGRLNSSYYQGLLRANILEGKIYDESVDRLNSFDVPLYPYGSRPYFYGSFFWKYLSKTYGPDLAYQLNQNYSERIPWFIETPIADNTSHFYNELLFSSYKHYAEQTQSEIQKIQASPHNTNNYLQGYFQRNLLPHPTENKAIYLSKTNTGKDDLRLITFSDRSNILGSIQDDKRLPLDRSAKTLRAVWSPDGSSLLLDRLYSFEGQYQYFDLYTLDLKTLTLTPITKGKRARDAFYINQNEIVMVVLEDDVFKLKKLSLANHEITNLYTAKIEEKILNPIATNNTIVFISKQASGQNQILQLTNNQSITVLYSSSYNLYSLSADANFLYWVDETNGLSNFIAYDVNKKTMSPLTNTSTAIIDGTRIENQVYISEINSQGAFYTIAKTPAPSSLASIRTKPFTPSEWKIDLLKTPETEYYSTLHLYPTYWLPFVLADANGTYTSITTSANDPANLQGYQVQVGYYSANDKWDKIFNYQNIYWDFLISLSAYETYEYLESVDNSIQRQRINLGVTTSLYPISEDLYLKIFIDLEKAGTANSNQRKAQGVGFNFTYDQTEPVPHGGMEPEEGYTLTLGYSEYFKKENYYDFKITEGYYTHYWGTFLPEHHVLQYRLAARKSDSQGRPLSLGSLTIGGNEITSDNYTFALRGYPSGNFLAWSAYLAQLNYTLPIYDIYRGSGTLPFFTKGIFANLVAETLAIDGAYYNQYDQLTLVDTDKTFSAYGLELKAATEVLYRIPIHFVLGYYFGTSENAGGEDRIYFRMEVPLL